MAAHKPMETIRVARYVDDDSDQAMELGSFTNKMGRAHNRAGKTFSVGSWTLTIVAGSVFSKSFNQLSSRDRSRLSIVDLSDQLTDRLKTERPREIDVVVRGIGLFGEKYRRGMGDRAKLGFVLENSVEVRRDMDTVQTFMSDNHLPEIKMPLDTVSHVTFGDISLEKVGLGKGDDPHMLVPRKVIIPETLSLIGVSAEYYS